MSTALMPSLEEKSLLYARHFLVVPLYPSRHNNKINLNNNNTLHNQKQTNLSHGTHISHIRILTSGYNIF